MDKGYVPVCYGIYTLVSTSYIIVRGTRDILTSVEICMCVRAQVSKDLEQDIDSEMPVTRKKKTKKKLRIKIYQNLCQLRPGVIFER